MAKSNKPYEIHLIKVEEEISKLMGDTMIQLPHSSRVWGSIRSYTSVAVILLLRQRGFRKEIW